MNKTRAHAASPRSLGPQPLGLTDGLTPLDSHPPLRRTPDPVTYDALRLLEL
ncbi:MAG: hypothetical protein AAGA57_03170 [Planctomycetota bacterium]